MALTDVRYFGSSWIEGRPVSVGGTSVVLFAQKNDTHKHGGQIGAFWDIGQLLGTMAIQNRGKEDNGTFFVGSHHKMPS